MISDFQRTKFEHMFSVFDITKDGKVSEADFLLNADRLSELRGIAAGSAAHSTMRQSMLFWWQGLSAADGDGDGAVTHDEFMAFWAHVVGQAEAEAEAGSSATADQIAAAADATFAVMDADSDGWVGPDEYRDFLKAWGVDVDFGAAFALLDPAGEGRMGPARMRELVTAFFLGNEPGVPGTYIYGPM